MAVRGHRCGSGQKIYSGLHSAGGTTAGQRCEVSGFSRKSIGRRYFTGTFALFAMPPPIRAGAQRGELRTTRTASRTSAGDSEIPIGPAFRSGSSSLYRSSVPGDSLPHSSSPRLPHSTAPPA